MTEECLFTEDNSDWVWSFNPTEKDTGRYKPPYYVEIHRQSVEEWDCYHIGPFKTQKEAVAVAHYFKHTAKAVYVIVPVKEGW